MLAYLNVLLLATDEWEAAELQGLLSPYVTLTCVQDLVECLDFLEKRPYDAVFCAWSFRSGTWNDVLKEIRERYLDLPVIILSRIAAEREWLDVLDAGAFDLLSPPYQERTLVAVLEHAAASRQARAWRNREIPLKQRVGTG